MDDVTDLVFREVVAGAAKPDVMFTEFTSADAMASRGLAGVARKLFYTEVQRPIVAQIWGNNPETFGAAAKYILDKGFDGIDLNMGCPDRKVMKRGCGAALINNKELAGRLINAVRQEAPQLPLSVKTRLGTDTNKTKEWISFLLSQDISALTLHARTAKDLSKVPADWEEIGKTVALRNKINPNIVIVGNGGVMNYKEIVEKHKTYGVDGVMVGTGIFHNRWIFEKSEDPVEHTYEEHIELLMKHTELFHKTWGNTKNFELMKKFFKIYVKGMSGSNELRQKLMETKSYEDFFDIMSQ